VPRPLAGSARQANSIISLMMRLNLDAKMTKFVRL
jgi:hypothetical protein